MTGMENEGFELHKLIGIRCLDTFVAIVLKRLVTTMEDFHRWYVGSKTAQPSPFKTSVPCHASSPTRPLM